LIDSLATGPNDRIEIAKQRELSAADELNSNNIDAVIIKEVKTTTDTTAID